MPEYARKLAEFIQGVRTERDIRISVTGIANEPAGFKPEQMAEAIRALRRELDVRHLQDVQIIAPESASADDSAMRCIAGIKAEPGAWASLRGIATHSYNMAATPEFAEIIAGTGKQYWMTEAADNGNESEADVSLAASSLKLSSIIMYNINFAAVPALASFGKEEKPLSFLQLGYAK